MQFQNYEYHHTAYQSKLVGGKKYPVKIGYAQSVLQGRYLVGKFMFDIIETFKEIVLQDNKEMNN